MIRTLTVAVLALSLPIAAAQAQGDAPMKFGAQVGFVSSTFSGDDAPDAERITGFSIGAYLTRQLTDMVAFRPEVHYATRGSETRLGLSSSSGTFGVDLAYLDVPLLVQVERTTDGGLRPHAYAGPSIGLQISCDVSASGGGSSSSASCDDADLGTNSLEVAAVIGAGVGFMAGSREMTVGARYHQAFSDLADSENIRNSALSVYVSLGLGSR